MFLGPGVLGWGGRSDGEDNWIHITWSRGHVVAIVWSYPPLKKAVSPSFLWPLCAPTIPQWVWLGRGGCVRGVTRTEQNSMPLPFLFTPW